MQIVHLAIFLFNNKCELFYLYLVLNKRKKDLGLGGSETLMKTDAYKHDKNSISCQILSKQ